MRILYLAHRVPYPPNKGDKIRTFNEIRYLSQNHDIDLLTIAEDPDDMQYKKKIGEILRPGPHICSEHAKIQIKQHGRPFDIVQPFVCFLFLQQRASVLPGSMDG